MKFERQKAGVVLISEGKACPIPHIIRYVYAPFPRKEISSVFAFLEVDQ
jgi:hypothetical protein